MSVSQIVVFFIFTPLFLIKEGITENISLFSIRYFEMYSFLLLTILQRTLTTPFN